MSHSHCQKSGNSLLVKDDVGKAKPSCYDLPEFGFAFGKPQDGDVEGSKEVTSNWAEHHPSKKKKACETNFVKMNMGAAAAAATKTKTKAPTRGARMPIPSDVDPNFCYGKAGRPSTPIAGVFGNQYGNRAEAEAEANENRPKAKVGAAKGTKAAEGHRQGAQKRLEALSQVGVEKRGFRMKKFENIQAQTKLPPSDWVEQMKAQRNGAGAA